MDGFEFVDLMIQYVPEKPGYYPVVKRNGRWFVVQPRNDPTFVEYITPDRSKAADVVRFLRDKGEEAVLVKTGADPVS